MCCLLNIVCPCLISLILRNSQVKSQGQAFNCKHKSSLLKLLLSLASDLCNHQIDTLVHIYNWVPLLGFAPAGHLYFSIISCIFAEALDRNCCMFLIVFKIFVPLSEETNEDLVKYFYAPQMVVCLVTVSKLHHFVWLTREYIALYMWFTFLFIELQNFQILQTFNFIQIAQEQSVVV